MRWKESGLPADLILMDLGLPGMDGLTLTRILKADDMRKNRPDVVLVDLLLPGTDGLALVRQMKKDPRMRAIPVVAVTAHPERWSKRDALAAGCDVYLVKPIDTRTLPEQLAAVKASGLPE
jgi:CheY-like chemotaxis protein